MGLKKGALAELRRVFGGDLSEAPEDRYLYGYDATWRQGLPDLVVFPRSPEQVARLLRLAQEEGFPVVPRGAGTGLSGGAVPLAGGVVVALQRLAGVQEINRADLLAVAGAGTITAHLQAAVEAEGLFYPPDPGSAAVCTLGGNVAECAGGPRGLKYGVTRDYLLGLEVVTPTGEVLRTGGRTVKNVTGYDLTRLFCGSEGTLGIITGVTLRLLPLPAARRTVLAVYRRLEDACATVAQTLAEGILPAALELLDDVSVGCVEEHLRLGLPREAGALLLLEVDGTEGQVAEEARRAAECCASCGAERVTVAGSPQEAERLWQARRAVPAAVARLKPTKVSEDATVPRSRLPELVRRIKEIAGRHGLTVAVFGHAGDGNLHPNFLVDRRDPDEMRRLEEATAELFRAALDLGGTLSGEHGIGYLKAPYLAWELGEEGLSTMRRLKKALDPAGILNPGLIFSS